MSDVFSSDQNTANGTESTSEANPVSDLLATIVNEDGVPKYDSVEKALGGLKHAQEHIAKLQQEAAERQAELDKRLAAEDVLKELKASKQTDEKPSSQFDAEAIKGMVHNELEALTSKQRAAQNISTVNERMTSKFGEKAGEMMATKAKELGLSLDKAKELAGESPDALLAMFGLASNQQGTVSPGKVTSSIDTERENFSDSGTKNWRYWQKLRRESPKEYTARYTEMFKSRESMSAEDWNR